jgi:hypothetical protein
MIRGVLDVQMEGERLEWRRGTKTNWDDFAERIVVIEAK